jgi:hypothetical protein
LSRDPFPCRARRQVLEFDQVIQTGGQADPAAIMGMLKSDPVIAPAIASMTSSPLSTRPRM